jgi:hypothetical protein
VSLMSPQPPKSQTTKWNPYMSIVLFPTNEDKKKIRISKIKNRKRLPFEYGYEDGRFSLSTRFEMILSPASIFSSTPQQFTYWVRLKARNRSCNSCCPHGSGYRVHPASLEEYLIGEVITSTWATWRTFPST